MTLPAHMTDLSYPLTDRDLGASLTRPEADADLLQRFFGPEHRPTTFPERDRMRRGLTDDERGVIAAHEAAADAALGCILDAMADEAARVGERERERAA